MGNKQIFLIHWNRAEAEELAQALRAAGWQAELEAEDGARAAAAVKANPPDAIVIFLSRLPSHGRRTAAHLAEHKSTRAIPVIFVGGEGEALEKTRAALPGASYLTEPELLSHLKGLLG